MPAERTQLQKSLVGPAGEHYVLFRLYQQGLLASLAPPGAPTVDILILAPDESVIANLQVKTRARGNRKAWMMRQKHEDIVHPRYFYAFVDLEPNPPVTYIMPSKVVAAAVRESHASWLSQPGRGGRQRQDSPMRRILYSYGNSVEGFPPGWIDEYRERWDFLVEAVD